MPSVTNTLVSETQLSLMCVQWRDYTHTLDDNNCRHNNNNHNHNNNDRIAPTM
jgi:hypothetical protein